MTARPRPGWDLARFFLIVLGGAVVLGPLLYFFLRGFAPVPFHRCMDRALLFTALTAAWPRTDLRAWWPWEGAAGGRWLLGFAAALVTAQIVLGFETALGGMTWTTPSAKDLGHAALLATLAALLVPPLEETIYRGYVQSELACGLGARGAVVVGAVIYMLSHFLKIPAEIDRVPVRLWSGVAAVGAAFGPVLRGDFLGFRGLNLFILGLIFGGVFRRWGTLWLNAGLHAGLVLTLLLVPVWTHPAEDGILGGNLLANPLTTGGLLLLGWWLWVFYRRHWPEPERGENPPST